MADPKRVESHLTSEVADRDSRAEALLIDGLDRYFGGRYDDAIHLWTRVLFLDRSHARARAYIDRARTALAERQRRAEEMLHTSGELLAEGHTDQARALLTQAVAASGDDEQAAELRLRLERIERARSVRHEAVPAAVVDAMPIPDRRGVRYPAVLASAVMVVGFVLITVSSGVTVQNLFGFGATREALAAVGRTAPLPILSRAEAALVRARTLYSRGRLAEALQMLDRVDTGSTNRLAADELRVEIQQILLAGRRGNAPADAGIVRGRP